MGLALGPLSFFPSLGEAGIMRPEFVYGICYTYIHVIYAYTYIDIHIRIDIYIYTYVCIHVHVYVYVYLYMLLGIWTPAYGSMSGAEARSRDQSCEHGSGPFLDT